MITPERILIIKKEIAKDELIQSLCERIAGDWGSITPGEMTDLVLHREAALPTRFGPFLAVPHAIVPDEQENRLAAAVIPDGVEWDNDRENPIRLVVLLAGGRKKHLQYLSELADRLRDESFQRELIEAGSPREFLSVFTRETEHGTVPWHHGGRDISALVFEEALRLQSFLEPSKLILHTDAIRDTCYIQKLVSGRDVLVVTSRGSLNDESLPDSCRHVILPFKGERCPPDIRFSLLYLLGIGAVARDDVTVNIFGKPGSGVLDSIRIMHLDNELAGRTPAGDFKGFPQDIDISIFNRVIQIALELAVEGREGKPVGTIFVLGDREGVLPYTTKLIANPFHGYAPEDRNILDPGIEETVKEYAKIDGAFIISGNGTVESAGTYLSGQPPAEEMKSGLGARHAAAQGITAVSGAVAVVISESTRRVTVFQAGKKVMEL